jgi:tRNA (guanine-N7-)-methyltransferase
MAIASESATNLIYELRSILQPLELAELFPQSQPLEVELGCGDASFLVNYAKLHPERNFLGIERLNGRLRKLDRKGRRLGLANVRGVRIESAYFLEYLLPKHSATALHIYFPDPWPKRRHWKNRLINERFPQLAHSVLAREGIVFLRTDDRTYFDQMKQEFGASPLFREVSTPDELSAVVTDFEKNFNARGIATLRAAYRRD